MHASYVADWKGENTRDVNKKSNWRERWEEVRVCQSISETRNVTDEIVINMWRAPEKFNRWEKYDELQERKELWLMEKALYVTSVTA